MAVETARSRAKRILVFAWPILVGQWATMAFAVIDTIMTGHSSAEDLAAMALGSAIYSSVFVGLLGVIIVLTPIIAQHYGGGRHREIGQSFSQGVWLSVWLTLIGWLLLASPDRWLAMSDVTIEVRDRVSGYLHALMFALPAALLIRTISALNNAVSRPKIVMLVSLFGLVMKLPLNYVLIFGKFGAPAMGAAGCGVASAIVLWISCALALAIIRFDPFFKPFAIAFTWPRWVDQRELLRLGVPTGLSYMVEVTSFTFMALLVARLGPDVTGGHQITANLGALCYMIPLALSVATATLTAQAIGASDAGEARQIVRIGLALAFFLAAITASAVVLFRSSIIAAYTSDPAVASVAYALVPFLLLFHVMDATQSVAGFTLRAYKRTVAPMLIYVVCLWGLGLGGGYWIAFHPFAGFAPMGAAGLWLAAAASLAISASALVVHLNRVAAQAIARETRARPESSIAEPA